MDSQKVGVGVLLGMLERLCPLGIVETEGKT